MTDSNTSHTVKTISSTNIRQFLPFMCNSTLSHFAQDMVTTHFYQKLVPPSTKSLEEPSESMPSETDIAMSHKGKCF
jgi:hypothetical protein